MKKTFAYILAAAFAIGLISTADASMKKREPDRRDVEKRLKKIGGEHYVEEMEVDDLGRVDTELEDDSAKAYYWIFVGELPDDAGFHLIIYDNEDNYLGFYRVKNEPTECGDGYIAFEIEDTGGEPDPMTDRTDTKSIRLQGKGPEQRITMSTPEGTPAEFVKAPTMEEVEAKVKAEREAAAEDSATTTSSKPAPKKLKPEYRSWKVKHGDRMITVESAIFVKYKNGKVTIKNAKNGKTATIPLKNFSEADQKYLKELIK